MTKRERGHPRGLDEDAPDREPGMDWLQSRRRLQSYDKQESDHKVSDENRKYPFE